MNRVRDVLDRQSTAGVLAFGGVATNNGLRDDTVRLHGSSTVYTASSACTHRKRRDPPPQHPNVDHERGSSTGSYFSLSNYCKAFPIISASNSITARLLQWVWVWLSLSLSLSLRQATSIPASFDLQRSRRCDILNSTRPPLATAVLLPGSGCAPRRCCPAMGRRSWSASPTRSRAGARTGSTAMATSSTLDPRSSQVGWGGPVRAYICTFCVAVEASERAPGGDKIKGRDPSQPSHLVARPSVLRS